MPKTLGTCRRSAQRHTHTHTHTHLCIRAGQKEEEHIGSDVGGDEEEPGSTQPPPEAVEEELQFGKKNKKKKPVESESEIQVSCLLVVKHIRQAEVKFTLAPRLRACAPCERECSQARCLSNATSGHGLCVGLEVACGCIHILWFSLEALHVVHSVSCAACFSSSNSWVSKGRESPDAELS